MNMHTVYTPYSFSVQKSNKVSCCGVMRTPAEFRDLVMQHQPTPQPDKNWDGNFLRFDDELNQAKKDPDAITNLSALPSSAGKKHIENGKNKQATLDSDLLKELGLKSWDAKQV